MLIPAESLSTSYSLYERASYLYGVGLHAVLWLFGSSLDESNFLSPKHQDSEWWRRRWVINPFGHIRLNAVTTETAAE